MDKCQWRCDHCGKLMDDSKACCKASSSAAQSDERAVLETLPYIERFSESYGEGGGVYRDEDGDFVRYSDYEKLASSLKALATATQACATLTDEQINAIWANTDARGSSMFEPHKGQSEMRRRFARALLAAAQGENP